MFSERQKVMELLLLFRVFAALASADRFSRTSQNLVLEVHRKPFLQEA